MKVNANPGSKLDGISAVEDDYIGVSVMAPAKDGKANDAIKELIAFTLGIKKRDVSIAKGEKSSEKIIMIDNEGQKLSCEDIIKLLKESM